MEKELIIRELTVHEMDLAIQWQVFPEQVRHWVDVMGMPTTDMDETVEWVLKDDHLDLVMEAKREFFEDSLFSRKFREEPAEAAS